MPATPTEISNWMRFHELFSAAFAHEALGTAAELGVAEVIGDEPRPAIDIAGELGLHPDALYRLLRALSAYGLFEETKSGFRHNDFSRQLRVRHPYSFAGMAKLWHSEPLRKAWGQFPAAVRSGRSAFEHGNGRKIYEYLEANPRSAELFHQAMENNSAVMADAIAGGFSFGSFRSVVDLGGGFGTLLAAILEKYPIEGAVYDVAVVATSARNYFAEKGLTDRARFIEGNWFESIPEGFDVYIVKNSLWNWRDEDCARILSNSRRAMSSTAQLLLIEYFPNAKAPWTTAFDLQQLNVTGGRGRTVEEYRALVENAGMKVSASFSIGNQNVLQCSSR